MNLLLVVIAVLGVSASGPLMAYAVAPALAIGFWRNALGVAALAPVRPRRTARELRGLSAADRRRMLGAGLALAVHFAAWISALQMTSVAAATAMVSMQVVFVVLIDRLRGIRVGRQVAAGIVVAIAGVLIITGVDLGHSARALAGDGLALLGGLAAAGYLITGAALRDRVATTTYAVGCYGVCSVALLVACLVTGAELVRFGGPTWLAIIGVTVCAQLLGHTVLNHLLAVMSPTVISLVLLLEVPGAALLAGWFLDQTPPAEVGIGLVVILVGLAVVTAARDRSGRTTTEAPVT
ncbi:MAG TPA: DMT family transporter [Aeromicrobium sp.]|nr:DMT family transporter [Aeromicrobium sp.]